MNGTRILLPPENAMIKNYFLNPQKLPLVIEAEPKNRSLQFLLDLAKAEKDFFLAEMLKYGALLFRGFDVRTADEFREFVRGFSEKEFFNYAGGASPRSAVQENVYNSTEYPPDLALELHNELSYSRKYPRHLYFFCETAPAQGGETTLGDSRRIRQEIRPEIVELFKTKGVLYERYLRAETGFGYSWQEAFETADRQKIEDICRAMSADFDWQENDCLRLRQVCPATAEHPETGAEVWFNQAHGFHASALDAETLAWYQARREKPRLNSYFGDGSPICTLTLAHIRDVLRRLTVPHRWRAGDILILDNMLTAHGRMPFAGARKIILAMT
jgi:alpha-ketoglutarate-dependent taurine dioxygenase